ncbi:hypothetical protein ES703_34748 [subsurface metagenome]
MGLTELIIKAHVTVHAAELAIKADDTNAAYKEMASLNELMRNRPDWEEVVE